MISASRCSLVECLISWPHLHSSLPAQPKERTHFRTEQVSPWREGQSGPATPPGAQPSPPGRTASPRMMPTSRRSRTASRSFTCFPSCLNSQNLNVEQQYDMTDIHILSRLWDKLIVSRWWAQPGTMLIAQTQCLPMHVRGHLPDWNQNTCTNTQKYNTCICLMIVPQRVYIFNVNQVAKLMKAMGDKKVDVAVLGYFVWLDHRSDVCDHVSWS